MPEEVKCPGGGMEPFPTEDDKEKYEILLAEERQRAETRKAEVEAKVKKVKTPPRRKIILSTGLTRLRITYREDLVFLVEHLGKMSDAAAQPPKALNFIAHIKTLIEKLDGDEAMSDQHAEEYERHIVKTLLPVKARLKSSLQKRGDPAATKRSRSSTPSPVNDQPIDGVGETSVPSYPFLFTGWPAFSTATLSAYPPPPQPQQW